MKNIKVSLGKKKSKGEKRPEKNQYLTEEEKDKNLQYHHEHNKNLSEEQKKKLVEYRSNYYITCNKQLFGYFTDFLKILGQFYVMN